MKDKDFSAKLTGELINRHIPNRTIDRNVFLINSDYSIAVGWKLNLASTTYAPKEILATIHQRIGAILLSLPEHFDIQVVHTTDHRHKEILEGVWGGRTGTPVQEAYISEQREQMRSRYENGDLTNRAVYFFLISSVNKSLKERVEVASETDNEVSDETKRGFVERVRDLVDRFKTEMEPDALVHKNLRNLESRQLELKRYSKAMDEVFDNLKMNPALLDADELIEVLFKRYNPTKYDRGDKTIAYRRNEAIPLPEYILDEDFKWDKDGTIKIGETFFRIFSLTMPPAEFEMPSMEQMLYGSGVKNIAQVTYAKQGSIEARKESLKKNLKRLKPEIDENPDKQAEYQEYFDELEELGAGNDKIWLSATFFLIWADELETLSDYEIRLTSTARENDCIIAKEKLSSFDYWRVIHPAWTRDRDTNRENFYRTAQLVSTLPLAGSLGNLDQPIGACFESDIGAPYNINFHNSKRFANYNWIGIGGSGSGKSFTFGTIAYNFKINYPDAKIIIVDLDGSYEGIAAAFNGQYIAFDPDSTDQVINPFKLAAGKTKADNETIQMWRMDLEQKLVDRGNGQERLPPEEISDLEKMLYDMVDSTNGKEFTLSEIRNAMDDRPELKRLAKRLSRWCQGGTYGNLCDGKTSIGLTSDFIVFDLKQTANNPELAPVIFTMVANLINQLGQTYMGAKKLLAFDEAWRILKDKHQQSFLELAFRAYRKNGFSVGGISQGIGEWANLPNGEAFSANITNIIISRLDASDGGKQAELLKDFLNVPDTALRGISTLDTVPGHYAELMLIEKTTSGTEVSRLINRPSPLFYALATTNAADKAEIKSIQEEEGITLVDAKIKFSERYPNGV